MYLPKTTMILLLAGPALAQLAKTNDPAATVSEGQLIQALMTEMRQLRQALERAVFVSSRIQIATQSACKRRKAGWRAFRANWRKSAARW